MALVVPASLEAVRLDRAVAMVAGCSRREAAELIAAGAVRLDGRPARLARAGLAAGQRLEVDRSALARPALVAEGGVPVTVVYEDPAVVVVDKPAGLVVHPGAGHPSGTLAAGLLARYPELARVGDPARPGLVHRLDRGTSGLLVVARSPEAYRALTHQLARRAVERRYLVLVEGQVADEAGVVEAPIGRSARDPRAMAVTARGRPARTAYRVQDRLPRSTLLEAVLETGRTHQVRVHLAALGHPVVGDARYGATTRLGLEAGRTFLHAHRLGLEHPSDGRALSFSSPLPEDLERALAQARR